MSEPTKAKIGMFEENAGELSYMRVASFLALLAALGFGTMAIILSSEVGLWITTMFLVAAFAPKAIQKFAEHENLFKR